ncbi:hypothetical protein TNCV_87821 [Trichonephila clavipes]|nr:hypothetical protein TNCV_87821 [Trichonephila clavipes]
MYNGTFFHSAWRRHDSTMDFGVASPVGLPHYHHTNPWWTSQHDKWRCHAGSNNDPTRKITTALPPNFTLDTIHSGKGRSPGYNDKPRLFHSTGRDCTLIYHSTEPVSTHQRFSFKVPCIISTGQRSWSWVRTHCEKFEDHSSPSSKCSNTPNLRDRWDRVITTCQVIYSQFGLAIHQNDHQARRRFVEWAQNEIAVVPDFHKRILFSDEAHFWLNGYVNKQNCRIWSEANPQVYVETPLHPEKLTVCCALWAGGILLQKR